MMRKTLLALTLTTSLLAGCNDPERTPMSPEEDYVMNAYAAILSAYAYDEVCNKALFTGNKNPVLIANRSMIATQVYNAFRNSHPQTPEAETRRAVEASGQTMHDNEVKMLKDKGCKAEELKPFEEALGRYTTVGPDDNFQLMQKDMRDKGIQPGQPVPSQQTAPGQPAPLQSTPGHPH